MSNKIKNVPLNLQLYYRMFRWSFLFKTSACWILPTVIFVYSFYKFENISIIINSKYIKHALNEAISPFLWNFLGVIVFFTAGLSISALSISRKISIFFSKIAHKVLSITYEMGFLIFGIMVGKLIFNFKLATMPIWEKWFYGVSFLLLFFIIFGLNTLLWLLDEIIINIETKKTKTHKIIEQLSNKPKWISIFFGIILIILSISSLIFDRTI